MNQVSIIGAGTMGNGIAQSFALNGFQVFLIDIQEENLSNAEKTISENLERMIKKEIINQQHKENTLSKIRFQTDMNEDVKNSDLVIEAVTESENIKLEIFKKLDTLCDKKTILATNTSSISIKKIANVTKRPEKVIGMHFMNPVPIMKLVEVINTMHTSAQTTQKIIEISEMMNFGVDVLTEFAITISIGIFTN